MGKRIGGAAGSDPRRVDAVTAMRMKVRQTDEPELSEGMATYMSLLAMVCGIAAIIMKVGALDPVCYRLTRHQWKVMAFQSIVCTLVAFSNTKSAEMEVKQFLSSVS